MPPRYTVLQRTMLATLPRFAAGIIRLLLATLRYEVVLEPGAQTAFDHPKPCIFVFWHRALLPSSAYFGPLKIAIMISQSFDGELIARTSQRLGYVPVRGSSSRGGSAGLEALHQAYNDGHLISLTVDGPRGPKYVAKPGAVKLAQLTGSCISAFFVLPQHAWTMKSWDGFLIPKPFSRVVVTYAKPVAFNPDFDAMLAEVQASLERSVQMAEEYWNDIPAPVPAEAIL